MVTVMMSKTETDTTVMQIISPTPKITSTPDQLKARATFRDESKTNRKYIWDTHTHTQPKHGAKYNTVSGENTETKGWGDG